MNVIEKAFELGDVELIKTLVNQEKELKAGFNKELSEFHKTVKSPSKNGHVNYQTKAGGRKKYDYVTMNDLVKAIDDALGPIGMSWSQDVEVKEGMIRVRTIIRASNGFSEPSHWIEFKTSSDPQIAGSAITYAKRYSLNTVFGVNSEPDDDGENASETVPAKQQNARSTSTNVKRKAPVKVPVTDQQLRKIDGLIQSISALTKRLPEEVVGFYSTEARVDNFSDLSVDNADLLIKTMEEQIAKNTEVGTNA